MDTATIPLPSVSWVRQALRNDFYAPRRITVLSACVVGSTAKGTAGPDSDLDIAVVIPPVRWKTSVGYTGEYHSKFRSDAQRPKFGGRVVDFQFFFPDDTELASYSKIQLG